MVSETKINHKCLNVSYFKLVFTLWWRKQGSAVSIRLPMTNSWSVTYAFLCSVLVMKLYYKLEETCLLLTVLKHPIHQRPLRLVHAVQLVCEYRINRTGRLENCFQPVWIFVLSFPTQNCDVGFSLDLKIINYSYNFMKELHLRFYSDNYI